MDNVINNKTGFEYTYSAKQQQELESIRKKYLPKEENKMDKIRRLDREAERPGTVMALVIGIIGTLIMGAGMSCAMLAEGFIMGLGIVIGLVGIVVLGIAYPMYKKITKEQRAKVAEEIIALSNEITM